MKSKASRSQQQKGKQQENPQQIAISRFNKPQKFLNLTSCPQVWEKVLEIKMQSDDWDNLLYLRLDSCKISNYNITALKEVKWSNIKQINLNQNKIGNNGIKQLSKTELLVMRKVSLQKCLIGDEGAKHLTKMRCLKLKNLNLSNNPIGFQGKVYLLSMECKQMIILSEQIKTHIASITKKQQLIKVEKDWIKNGTFSYRF